MKDLLLDSAYFGIFISVLGYMIGMAIAKRFRRPIFNPLLISVAFVILVLLVTGVSFDHYNQSASHLSYLLTPATVCLAVPLYQQLHVLKQQWRAILLSILAGTITSAVSILLFSMLFHLDHAEYITLLPKSVTSAISYSVSQDLGGVPSLTIASATITGLLGNIAATALCKLFRIKNPVAVGLAIGTSSHALGTSRALELGEVQGAMSSLSIAVAGLITVVLAPIFANFF